MLLPRFGVGYDTNLRFDDVGITHDFYSYSHTGWHTLSGLSNAYSYFQAIYGNWNLTKAKKLYAQLNGAPWIILEQIQTNSYYYSGVMKGGWTNAGIFTLSKEASSQKQDLTFFFECQGNYGVTPHRRSFDKNGTTYELLTYACVKDSYNPADANVAGGEKLFIALIKTGAVGNNDLTTPQSPTALHGGITFNYTADAHTTFFVGVTKTDTLKRFEDKVIADLDYRASLPSDFFEEFKLYTGDSINVTLNAPKVDTIGLCSSSRNLSTRIGNVTTDNYRIGTSPDVMIDFIIKQGLGRGKYGFIKGVVKEYIGKGAAGADAEGNIPVQREVFLYHQKTGVLMGKQWSKQDGTFFFDLLDPQSTFMLASVDYQGRLGFEGNAFKKPLVSVWDGVSIQYPTGE